MKKTIIVLCLVMMFMFSYTSVAMADTLKMSYSNGSHTFNADWMESRVQTEINGTVNRIQYGFNTFLIDEDVCYTKSNGSFHYPVISRAGYVMEMGSYAEVNDWASLEITHRSNRVTYQHWWPSM